MAGIQFIKFSVSIQCILLGVRCVQHKLKLQNMNKICHMGMVVVDLFLGMRPTCEILTIWDFRTARVYANAAHKTMNWLHNLIIKFRHSVIPVISFLAWSSQLNKTSCNQYESEVFGFQITNWNKLQSTFVKKKIKNFLMTSANDNTSQNGFIEVVYWSNY